MGMCEWRTTLGTISCRRVRERDRTLCVLQSGFCQFVHGVHSGPAGGPRVPGLFRINMVGPHVSELFGQVYMLFITWRYPTRLKHYSSLERELA
jgi:hypothetical protein